MYTGSRIVTPELSMRNLAVCLFIMIFIYVFTLILRLGNLLGAAVGGYVLEVGARSRLIIRFSLDMYLVPTENIRKNEFLAEG